MIECALPNADAGVALRISQFLTCQAQALGENGYQALAGGPIVASVLTGLVTIFVALVGYRFLLGSTPTIRDGVSWAVRLGVVLTFATSWPAFQVVVYRVSVEAPGELAAVLLPSSGLSDSNLDERVQRAYDTIRLGSTAMVISQPEAATAQQGPQAVEARAAATDAIPGILSQSRSPQTASLFVVSTLGLSAGIRLASGFLLALGPLAAMALLFDATAGLFIGWAKALLGTTLALLGATLVTSLHVLLVESELAHLQSVERGVTIIDPQALITIVVTFATVMLATIWAATKMAGAIAFSFNRKVRLLQDAGSASALTDRLGPGGFTGQQVIPVVAGGGDPPLRARGVASALSASVRRENITGDVGGLGTAARASNSGALIGGGGEGSPALQAGLGATVRRSQARKARSAMRRDGTG
ncbi:type IV secretion system protein [Sphingomonas sp. 3-13AW]|uniref:type IV secretion system protein n=1 Tax=Sphingomonas sp. 3-13AW TaxID=3050450 RepID=UPI003BB5BEA9